MSWVNSGESDAIMSPEFDDEDAGRVTHYDPAWEIIGMNDEIRRLRDQVEVGRQLAALIQREHVHFGNYGRGMTSFATCDICQTTTPDVSIAPLRHLSTCILALARSAGLLAEDC